MRRLWHWLLLVSWLIFSFILLDNGSGGSGATLRPLLSLHVLIRWKWFWFVLLIPKERFCADLVLNFRSSNSDRCHTSCTIKSLSRCRHDNIVHLSIALILLWFTGIDNYSLLIFCASISYFYRRMVNSFISIHSLVLNLALNNSLITICEILSFPMAAHQLVLLVSTIFHLRWSIVLDLVIFLLLLATLS